MGACDFVVREAGKTAKEAFYAARERALWEHGHGGYTGTIAEKHEFTVVERPEDVKEHHFIDWIVTGDDEDVPTKHLKRVQQARAIWSHKWGPALAIQSEGETWLFLGLASS